METGFDNYVDAEDEEEVRLGMTPHFFLGSVLIDVCSRLNSFPQIYVYPEPQNVTSLGNRVFADDN